MSLVKFNAKVDRAICIYTEIKKSLTRGLLPFHESKFNLKMAEFHASKKVI